MKGHLRRGGKNEEKERQSALPLFVHVIVYKKMFGRDELVRLGF